MKVSGRKSASSTSLKKQMVSKADSSSLDKTDSTVDDKSLRSLGLRHMVGITNSPYLVDEPGR